jgi:DNA polymerase delta subunit 2
MKVWLTTVVSLLGVVMGVLGSESSNGDFKVIDVCYAGQGPQEQHTLMETGTTDINLFMGCYGSDRNMTMYGRTIYSFSFSHTDEADKYIALVSGLGIGGNDFKPLELDLLAEYLTGEIGGVKVQLTADAEQINP